MKSNPSAKFGILTRWSLRRSGWRPNTSRGIPWDSLPDLAMPDTAKKVLEEFFGLKVGIAGPGKDCARVAVNFNPHELKKTEQEVLRLRQKAGRQFYPLGEIDGGHAILLIDEIDWTYMWIDDLPVLIAKNFEDAIERMLSGRKYEGAD